MFWLIYTINVIFYQQNGISVSQITVLDVVWAVTAFLLEVPSGALSDRWSRKYMLALGSLWSLIGFLIYAVSGSFVPFVIASVFMAARLSFASGTTNALLYDTLKEIKMENEFEKILGRARLFEILSISVAGIAGGLLAVYNIRTPFLLSALSAALATLIALSFKEPKSHTSTEEIKFFDHLKKSGKYVLTNPFIRFLLLYLVLMDIAISYLDEYDQLYLTFIGMPLAFFGIWIAIRRALLGLGGFFANKFKKLSSSGLKVRVLLLMIFSLGLISFGGKFLGLAVFLLIFPVWGVAEILIWGEIHSKIESYQRATVESFIVFFGVILDIPARLSFGYISEVLGIKVGYLFVMILLLFYLPYFLFRRRVLVK